LTYLSAVLSKLSSLRVENTHINTHTHTHTHTHINTHTISVFPVPAQEVHLAQEVFVAKVRIAKSVQPNSRFVI
jgi:hypothetical protein